MPGPSRKRIWHGYNPTLKRSSSTLLMTRTQGPVPPQGQRDLVPSVKSCVTWEPRVLSGGMENHLQGHLRDHLQGHLQGHLLDQDHRMSVVREKEPREGEAQGHRSR